MVWTCEKKGREGLLRKVKKMQVTGKRLPGKPKGRLEELVQGDIKKDGTRRGAGNGSKKLEKDYHRFNNKRERKGM